MCTHADKYSGNFKVQSSLALKRLIGYIFNPSKARNANHSNFGFVKYHDLNMAWKAKLAMNGKVLHRNAIRVGWGRPVPSKVLWVGGLGPEVTTNLLQRECSKYGSIYNIKLV